MSSPLISVNITTFNRSGFFLSRAVNSVLNQKYENLEIIIVDDGSTDQTQKQVETLQILNNNINYIRLEKNSGNAFARNVAYKASKGEYIAFMDDDDEWVDEYKLEKQLNIFQNAKCDKIGLVYSNVFICNDDNNPRLLELKPPKNLKSLMLRGNGLIYSPTVLTKKSIIVEAGGFDNNLKRGVDSDFYRNIILNLEYKICWLPHATTNIHVHKSQRMTKKTSFKAKLTHAIANIYVVFKYWHKYILDPKSLLIRISKIIVIFFK